MINDVVVVNDDLVFRFAKSEHAKDLLLYETQLLRVIERACDRAGSAYRILCRTYMQYRLVPGAPLYRHTLLRADATTQDRLAHQLATFFQQLHAIPLSEVPSPPWQTSSLRAPPNILRAATRRA